MPQQFIAFIIILFFIFKLYWQKKNKEISHNEFIFWMIFWLISLLAVLLIKKIDQIVLKLGFSGSGIEVILYAGVIMLFYFIFRLRLKIEKIERNITKIVREISLTKK